MVRILIEDWLYWFYILYAISDEVHQAFVPGRTYRVFDMLLDIAGASSKSNFIEAIEFSKNIILSGL